MNPIAELSKWYTYIELAMALAMMLSVMLRPKSFWYLILIGSIVGQGPRFLAYHVFDELLVGCVILGAIIRIAVLGPSRNFLAVASQQRAVYFLWIGYMIIESVVGVVFNDDLRIIRWIVFYTLLGLLPLIIYHYDDHFPFPPLKRVLQTILLTTLIYNLAYLGVGYAYDIILGSVSGRFSSQFLMGGFIWSGTATAVIPTLIALPAAIIVLTSRNYSVLDKLLGWLILSTSMVLALFYDSRIAWVVILGCFAVSITKFKVSTIIMMAVMFCLTFSFFARNANQNIGDFFSVLSDGVQTLWTGGEKGDVSRRLQFKAGFMRLIDNPVTFFVGDGIYSHRFTVIPNIEELYAVNLPSSSFKKPAGSDVEVNDDHVDNLGSIPIFRTTGFTALLVDTGLVGMFIFALNFFIVGVILLKQKGKYLLLFLFTLTLSFWWLFVNNVVDVIILYLLIMPGGLLERMNKSMIATPQVGST